jgi:hypothetical protein
LCEIASRAITAKPERLLPTSKEIVMLAPHLIVPATRAIKGRPLPTGWISACVVLSLMTVGIAQRSSACSLRTPFTDRF